MTGIDRLTVKYHGEVVGVISLTPDDKRLTAIERLSIVGNSGMGALTYEPETIISTGEEITDFDLLQEKALEVLKEQQDTDAGLHGRRQKDKDEREALQGNL